VERAAVRVSFLWQLCSTPHTAQGIINRNSNMNYNFGGDIINNNWVINFSAPSKMSRAAQDQVRCAEPCSVSSSATSHVGQQETVRKIKSSEHETDVDNPYAHAAQSSEIDLYPAQWTTHSRRMPAAYPARGSPS